ncbi:hypothetical protein ACHWQZ_G017253 [Mnemiopsis leidyi]
MPLVAVREFACSHFTAQILYEKNYKCFMESTVNHTSMSLKLKRDNLTCVFNMDENHYHIKDQFPAGTLPPNVTTSEISWSCELAYPSQLCNGYSECLTDECGCKNSTVDVFYCADGSGCITWDHLCDNIQQCRDGSDECFCPNHIVFFSTEIGQWACFSEEYYCETITPLSPDEDIPSLFETTPDILKKIDCSDKIEGEEKYAGMSPIKSCLDLIDKTNYLTWAPQEIVVDFCRVNCSGIDKFDEGWGRFCKHIVLGISFYPNNFFCNGTDVWEGLPIQAVCDGKTDCSNEEDELGCPLPDRFYCDPDVTAEWVNTDKVCDSVKDCPNGADECGTCQFEALSTSEFLIQSKIIVALTCMMGAVIISLNAKEGYKCWKMDCSSKNKAVDRIFLLQIFLYDGMMGLYLCLIVLAAIILKFKGDYCIIEQDWRASLFCPVLGVIFSMSSHGSLSVITLVSITRFLTCHSFVSECRERTVKVVSIFGACLNVFHSILPLLPIHAIQDSFRTAIFLENINKNPFFSSNPVNLSRLTEFYNRILHEEGEHDISKMSKDLNNITSRGNIFDFFEIGYYGNTGLCVHNIFKDDEGQFLYRVYKITYCTVLLILLSVVSFAYIKIVLKQRKSNKAVAGSNATGSNNSALTLKVALMIGSQLICWISFVITVLYFQYMTTKPAPLVIFEVFALVVIPINSFLNPVFYSELYKKLMKSFGVQRERLKDIWDQLAVDSAFDVILRQLHSFNVSNHAQTEAITAESGIQYNYKNKQEQQQEQKEQQEQEQD